MSKPKKYRFPMRFRLFKFRRWLLRGVARVLHSSIDRIEPNANLDPLVCATASVGELRIVVGPCTAEWEVHIKVKSNDGTDRFAAYSINEAAVLTSGYRLRDAIDHVCWEHCVKNNAI